VTLVCFQNHKKVFVPTSKFLEHTNILEHMKVFLPTRKFLECKKVLLPK